MIFPLLIKGGFSYFSLRGVQKFQGGGDDHVQGQIQGF
jgi:hypothetical protein